MAIYRDKMGTDVVTGPVIVAELGGIGYLALQKDCAAAKFDNCANSA